MATMLIDNHKQTILNLLQEGEALLQRIGDQENVQKLQTVHQEASDKKSPQIMFYGLYNAGKSTLINALCRKYVAETDDVPCTAAIQTVPWEGYTLIDTPGINAHAEHTEIAEKEIRQSDVILFIMDNADTFDNATVYQAIVDILKMGKPLAVVLNQKNVDEDEDPNIPVPDRKAIQRIVGKISSNLEVQSVKSGMQIVGKANNFLGIFPVNAFTAYMARECSREEGDMLYQASGVLSLRNAMNETIRRSELVYMLRTPLINLRDILREAIKHYQAAAIYGEKQQLAENREHLLESRQRLRDRLMADGLRKIEAILEEVKTAAASGQTITGVDERLNSQLNALLKEAAEQERAILQTEIKVDTMSNYRAITSGGPAHPTQEDDSALLGDLAQVVAFVIDTAPIPLPIPLPISIITAAVRLIFHLFKSDRPEDDPARKSQERLAEYYRWLNEFRDQEIKIKATYEKSVNDFLAQFYDQQLTKIDQSLAEVDGNCAEHTKNLRMLEHLLLCTSDEMAALSMVA